jgi:zinc protease
MLKKCFFVILLSIAPIAFAAPPTHEFNLENGLKILVREDHRAPVAVSQIWYKVGSSYEPSGITGISHVLEHMMFKGTSDHGPGEFSRIISANGGSNNAFTSRDYTAYFQRMAKDRLAVSFRLEADRMRRLQMTEEDFNRERRVVIEERRLRTEDSPQGVTYEQFNATAYVTSPYRNPIIGWMQDLKAMEIDDLKHWYQKWYAPNNAVLVVVGDVDPQAVLALAKTYFGPLEPSEPTILKPQRDIPQRGERRIAVQAPAELPYIILGYQVPVLNTAEEAWEPYALEVLSGILNAGDSSRLSRHLIRGSQVAASASAGYGLTSRLGERFILTANPAPDQDAAAVERALREQVRQLREELVDSRELARVVARVIAADVYQLDSMFYQGMRIGILETIGLGWNALDDYVERIQAVTPEQIREVARKYLVDERLTVATLEPQPLDRARPPSTGGIPDHIINDR